MTASHVAILYSVAQRRRRVLIVPDDDEQLAALSARPGEKLIFQSIDDFRQRGPDAAVADDAGGPPLPDRCAVIDKNNEVVAHVAADPAIDTLGASVLIVSEISKEGDVFDGGKIMRRYAEIDKDGRVERVVLLDPEQPPAMRDGDKLTIEADGLKPGDVIDRKPYDEPPVDEIGQDIVRARE